MRVISGNLKGRTLKCPKGNATRPVLDQVKEAIFNILPAPNGLAVLDLFAGTGALGIEAMSRGAGRAVFVESQTACATVLLQNLKNCGLLNNVHVLKRSYTLACRMLRKKKLCFDWIFCDPPYDQGLIAASLENTDLLALARADSILIMEHSPREMPANPCWTEIDRRQYGQTLVSFLKKR